MQLLSLGADVDSRYIVVACAAQSFAPRRIANERRAIVAWLRTLPPGGRLAMEATGCYHELLAELAQKMGLQVYVLNARDVRRYSEGVGRRGKTDRVDAEVIARYIEREHKELHAYVAPSKAQRALARLIARRTKLVTLKGALKQSLGSLPSLKGDLEHILARLDRLIEKLELLMQRARREHPPAEAAAEHIVTVPGFGTLTSTYLGYSFTRLPYSNSDAVVAHTGLDPRPDDSGRRRGRRRLSKRGPAEARRLLFNCARSAARMKIWRPYYEAQLAKGLSATAATVILARKMVRVAFAVYKRGEAFDPSRFARAA